MLERKFLYEIKTPRKDKKLPQVLSKEEVSRIINGTANIKHKAILMTIYSPCKYKEPRENTESIGQSQFGRR
jgi:site-specific recombinase XerD